MSQAKSKHKILEKKSILYIRENIKKMNEYIHTHTHTHTRMHTRYMGQVGLVWIDFLRT